jgi:hypothetical protein
MYSTAQINQTILTDIYTFLVKLSTTYGIPVETLKKTFHGETEQPCKEEEKKLKTTEPPKENKKVLPTGKCIYRYIRGAKAGVLCGTQIKNKNNFYCSKHKANETSLNEDVPLELEKTETPKKSKIPKEIEPPKTNVILRLNTKINKYVHPLSGLVFFSKEKREICGKLSVDKIVDLTEYDIETCKKYGFKILETKEQN